MEESEYKKMPRSSRLAVFLLVIGPEPSAPILRSLDTVQREAMVRSICEIDVVDESLQRLVLNEFSVVLSENLTALKGGKDAAVVFLESSLGAEEAEEISSHIGQPKIIQQFREKLSEMKPAQIWSAISDENPQVIAYLLSVVDFAKCAEILGLMEDELSSDVFVRMSQLGPTVSNLMPRVVENVLRSVPQEVVQSRVGLGGVERSAEVLKAFKSERSKELLSAVESVDQKLGNAISKEMFSFKDLVDLSSDGMQRIMREVDSELLVVAMKSASSELLEKIYEGLSKRGAEALKEEFEMQGSVRLAEVEAAQDAVLLVLRGLEANGDIRLGGDDEEYV